LALACQKGFAPIVSILLEYGANTKIHDEYGTTPVHWASNLNDPTILKMLLLKGGLSLHDLSIQDSYGSTPLHFAAVRNLPMSVSMLVLVS
jgi:ankyrin repeat protein